VLANSASVVDPAYDQLVELVNGTEPPAWQGR
jgi:hypothetical protein